jgi:hypothetical protein
MSAELNNVVPSWVDIRVRIDSVEIAGITGLSFGDKVEDEMVYGSRRLPRGRTRGRYVVDDASMTVHHDTFLEIIGALGDGWGDKVFEVVEQISLPNGRISTTVLESCRMKGAPGGGEEGVSALTRELPFSPMRIKRDGKYLITQRAA